MSLISVILCTLDEAPVLRRLLADLQDEDMEHEVICVDGGSRDDTVDIAAAYGCRVLSSAPGRGQQLSLGAGAARGDLLLFLHADCRFPRNGLRAVAATLTRRPECVGGNFRLLFDGDDEFSRWLTGFYARIRARGLYYGDSGIFVRRQVYQALGGLRPIALMEDYDFVRRMERSGDTVCIDQPPLVTSSRRFRRRRSWSIVGGWLLLHGLFHLRVPPAILARLYRSARHERHVDSPSGKLSMILPRRR